jgi:hypothetical protein
METFDNRIDIYIEKSADFAKPILIYLRDIIHKLLQTLKKPLNRVSHILIIKAPFAAWPLLNSIALLEKLSDR